MMEERKNEVEEMIRNIAEMHENKEKFLYEVAEELFVKYVGFDDVDAGFATFKSIISKFDF